MTSSRMDSQLLANVSMRWEAANRSSSMAFMDFSVFSNTALTRSSISVLNFSTASSAVRLRYLAMSMIVFC